MRNIFLSLGVSLLLTLALESVFYCFLQEKCRRDWLLLLLVNAITNPVVVLLFLLSSAYGFASPWLTLATEVAAMLIEWLLYRRFAEKMAHPLLFSLGANVFSYGVGWILQHVLVRLFRYL